jgi:hypothetical protein
MENDRRAIFFKYLQYGGVNAGQNYETGIPPMELKQMSIEEGRQARSQIMIPRDRQELEVNFEEVARGFLYVYKRRLFARNLTNGAAGAPFTPITIIQIVKKASALRLGLSETSSHICSTMMCVPSTRTTSTRRGESATLPRWSFGRTSN